MAFVQTTAVEGGGERDAVPATASSPLARVIARARASVWTPLAIRVLAITMGMLALAGIGAASILAGLDGVHIPADVPLGADIGSAWLAVHRDAPAANAGSGDAGAPAAAPHAGITKDGKVILNLATAEELTRLPGVGAKRAAAIVELRARLKRFRRATDLLRVRGIGPKSLKRMLPHLVVDPPAEGDAGTS